MRPLLTFAALTAVLTLAACGPAAQEPTADPTEAVDSVDRPVPSIVTEIEGTSPLEDDPWVQASRAEDTGYLMAVNTLDFSIPEFTETHDPDTLQAIYDFFVQEHVTNGAPIVMFPGPSIRLPLEVTPTADGTGADLVFCDASVDWAVSEEFPEPAYDLTNGSLLYVTMTTDARGNRVFASESEAGDACDATGAPVQHFDPAPVLPSGTISLDDVTPPND